ncbi:hypothetical protein L9F63_005329, partial [Diploptera punctata]
FPYYIERLSFLPEAYGLQLVLILFTLIIILTTLFCRILFSYNYDCFTIKFHSSIVN